MKKERRKSWKKKVEIVHNSWERIRSLEKLGELFYEKLFFLSPELRDKFSGTDFEHQHKLLHQGLEILVKYLDDEDKFTKKQITRLARTHNHYNLDIHPHSYYYWVEALILTIKDLDSKWYDDLEYYWRECISFPINFIISQYFVKDDLL